MKTDLFICLSSKKDVSSFDFLRLCSIYTDPLSIRPLHTFCVCCKRYSVPYPKGHREGAYFPTRPALSSRWKYLGVPRIFHWGQDWRTENWGRRSRAGWVSWGRAESPLPPARGFERAPLAPPAGVSGQSPNHPKVFHYFQHSGWPLLTL